MAASAALPWAIIRPPRRGSGKEERKERKERDEREKCRFALDVLAAEAQCESMNETLGMGFVSAQATLIAGIFSC